MTFSKETLENVKKGIEIHGNPYILTLTYEKTCKLLVELYIYKYINRDKYLELYDYLYSHYSFYTDIDITQYILEYKGELIDRIPRIKH